MEIIVERKFESKNSTIGELYIDGKRQCYTLEDIGRPVKVHGKTRIPAGRYKIKLRKEGGFHERMKNNSALIAKGYKHYGMLQVCDVPNYQYILIHPGNDADDTNGCLLLGVTKGKDFIGDSRTAYVAAYNKIAPVLVQGYDVWITYRDDNIQKI